MNGHAKDNPLMSAPGEESMEVEPLLQQIRETAEYVCKDEPFILQERVYKQQYSSLYFMRLLAFKNRMQEKVKSTWPDLPVTSVLGVTDDKEVAVVGTLFKQMKLKPSILDEYSRERSNVPLITSGKLTQDDDFLILEDDTGRVTLVGDVLKPAVNVTGTVLAVRGRTLEAGDFNVTAYLLPDLPPQPPKPLISNPKYMALLSGLHLGSEKVNPLPAQLLVDQLTGHLGGEQEQKLSSQIVRVVIAGGSVGTNADLLTGQPLSARDQSKLVAPIKELDLVLTQLAAAMPVDIMPGESDPANFSLPQQPLHPCLFPGASQYGTFVPATNPHQFTLDGISFLGTSGQNIDDIYRYSSSEDRLEIMEATLRWQHLAPTAPDTLACYPFHDQEPFVLSECPHVYFVGNQPEYATREVTGPEGQKVRLIALPSFSKSGTAVLVNLTDLSCHCLTFSTSPLEEG